MEAAPLTLAHTIARDALHDPTKAAPDLIEQHRAAALEFNHATQDVDDTEALRVLALLEQHHNRLAEIIKTHTTPPASVTKSVTAAHIEPPVPESPQQPSAQSTSSTSRVPSPVRQRRQPRDVSSSIASNLASARGIPQSNQQRPRQSSPISPSSASRHPQPISPQKPIQDLRSTSSVERRTIPARPARDAVTPTIPEPPPLPAQDEVSFQRFYNTFEGLLSKLSAPLAFAGLPLQPDETLSTTNNTPISARATATSDDPAISRLFSRAALRAVKDNQGPLGVHESFFVVPTSGGTVSYAGMLSNQEPSARPSGHARISSTASADPNEHFVDAQEMQRPVNASILSTKSLQGPTRSVPSTQETRSQKTLEELELENASLKQLTDKLSHRLYDWEKNAQNQSMALQQSIRNLQAPNASTRNHDPGGAPQPAQGTEHEQDLHMLEDALALAQRDLEKYGRENEKLKTVVMRYRERWEKLKEGARSRAEKEKDKGKNKDKDMQDEAKGEGEDAPDSDAQQSTSV